MEYKTHRHDEDGVKGQEATYISGKGKEHKTKALKKQVSSRDRRFNNYLKKASTWNHEG